MPFRTKCVNLDDGDTLKNPGAKIGIRSNIFHAIQTGSAVASGETKRIASVLVV